MNETRHHWLVDAINKSHPGTLPPDSLLDSTSSIIAWHTLHRKFGLSYQYIAEAVADTYGLSVVDIAFMKKTEDNPFSEQLCRKLGVFPYDLSGATPILATFDPRLSHDQQQQIGFLLGRNFELVITSAADVDTALTFLFAQQHESESRRLVDLTVCGDNEPDTVQLTKAIFREAIDKRASDIHIHPFVGGGAIRFRIDGVLVRIATVPKKKLEQLANYLNNQANLEVNPFIPQDGRFSLKYVSRYFDVRLSLLPAYDGMRIVCRLLEQGRQFSLANAGLSVSDYQALKRLVDWGSGIVLLTGPTGSGKTSTLYALLSELNSFEVNILTLEDPVEYVLPGISQVQVNKSQGRSFADTLRAMLRQDPDIVLIGEIRDAETANIAAQASLTGHLVLSTLHTNDALSSISRLLDLGLDQTMLADALIGVVAQRLVRRLCSACRVPVTAPLQAAEAEFYSITRELPRNRAVGCNECGFSGYKGRIPVTEIMQVSLAMRSALLNRVRDVENLRAVNKGFQTSMALGAAQWVISGETTPEEVYRELGLRFWHELATCHKQNFVGAPEGRRQGAGHRSGIMLLSADAALANALDGQLAFDIVAAVSEEEAAQQLKNNATILAIIIDTSLLRSEPEQWLSGLRAQLAWSGVPVLFLLQPGSESLLQLLDKFNASAVMLEPGIDLAALVGQKLSAILVSGRTN